MSIRNSIISDIKIQIPNILYCIFLYILLSHRSHRSGLRPEAQGPKERQGFQAAFSQTFQGVCKQCAFNVSAENHGRKTGKCQKTPRLPKRPRVIMHLKDMGSKVLKLSNFLYIVHTPPPGSWSRNQMFLLFLGFAVWGGWGDVNFPVNCSRHVCFVNFGFWVGRGMLASL